MLMYFYHWLCHCIVTISYVSVLLLLVMLLFYYHYFTTILPTLLSAEFLLWHNSYGSEYNIAASWDMMPLYSDRSMNMYAFRSNLACLPGYVVSHNYV